MIYLIWTLIGAIILIGIVGGYYQLMLFNNLKNKDSSNILFASWVFNSDNLNESGKEYRRKLFICWLLAFIIIITIQFLR